MPFNWIIFGFIAALVLWLSRGIALTGWRKNGVVFCRLALLIVLALALWGPKFKKTQQVARRVVYLVDGSASMDPKQRSWIASRIAQLEEQRPEAIQRAVAVFGADAQLLSPFSSERLTESARIETLINTAEINRSRTNLESALLFGASLLPPQQRTAVVLFSDGRETSGNAAGILAYLRRFQVAVFPEAVPLFNDIKTSWETLAVPAVAQRGAPIPIKLVIFNAAEVVKTAEVSVALQGVSLKRQRVLLRPGWQVITLPVKALARGTMAMDVSLRIPEDKLQEQRMAYTEVEGPPQLLLLQEQLTRLPVLADALKRRDIDIAVMRPEEFPTDEKALRDFDAVLLFNLPKSVLTKEQTAALRSYIESTGGGLITVGLGGRLSEELQKQSPLDALLPISFEPKGVQEAQRRVCFVMLIDRSASMLGPRIAATKRAAIELVKQLAPGDLVGILAFDTEPYIVAEVQPAGQLVGQSLVDKLVKLHSTGGTDILPALAAAANRLDASGATAKHIILLSDGNTPYQKEAYDALLAGFQQDGTTVSTIGIGPAFVNTDFLRLLAGATGGTYYLMRNPEELPLLVIQDTKSALGKLPFTEGYFSPTKSAASDWFADISSWPILKGFFTATAKPGALTDLTIDGGKGPEPLLARWTLGLGRVVSFASDADARWSPDWIRWPGFEGVWAQVVRWALKPKLAEELFVWVDESQASPQLMVEGALDAPKADLLNGAGVQQSALSLMQTGTWRWQANVDQVPSGWYQLVIESRQGQAPVFAKRWVQIGTPPQGPEVTGQPPQEMVLRQIAQSTEGAYQSTEKAFVPPTTTATTMHSRLAWWLPLFIIIFLIEIALRGSSML